MFYIFKYPGEKIAVTTRSSALYEYKIYFMQRVATRYACSCIAVLGPLFKRYNALLRKTRCNGINFYNSYYDYFFSDDDQENKTTCIAQKHAKWIQFQTIFGWLCAGHNKVAGSVQVTADFLARTVLHFEFMLTCIICFHVVVSTSGNLYCTCTNKCLMIHIDNKIVNQYNLQRMPLIMRWSRSGLPEGVGVQFPVFSWASVKRTVMRWTASLEGVSETNSAASTFPCSAPSIHICSPFGSPSQHSVNTLTVNNASKFCGWKGYIMLHMILVLYMHIPSLVGAMLPPTTPLSIFEACRYQIN